MPAPKNITELHATLVTHPKWPGLNITTEQALAVLASLGLAVVPVEPTDAMAKSGYEACNGSIEFISPHGEIALMDELRAAIAAGNLLKEPRI